MDYQEYENQCNEIRRQNSEYLSLFEEDMRKSSLTEKTIRRHLNNADFFINEFLLLADPIPMDTGMSRLDSFLGDFFIRKCMWSTPANIKSTAASIKKFYKSMLAHGLIDSIQYREFADTIKDNMKEWQEECARFNR